MRHRVRRVFEQGLDALLTEIDKLGAELIRIIPLPNAVVYSKDCPDCGAAMCLAHLNRWYEIVANNRHLDFKAMAPETLKQYTDTTDFYGPRYAVVYKEPFDALRESS